MVVNQDNSGCSSVDHQLVSSLSVLRLFRIRMVNAQWLLSKYSVLVGAFSFSQSPSTSVLVFDSRKNKFKSMN